MVKVKKALVAQWIERDVADVEVGSSTLPESTHGGVQERFIWPVSKTERAVRPTQVQILSPPHEITILSRWRCF